MTTRLLPPSGTDHGEFTSTASGTTYYEYHPGKRTSGTAIFIHGFALPSGVWEKNFSVLSRQGYSVLRFDRVGVGRSVTPVKKHSMLLFINQIKELIDSVRPPPPFSLVGLSMGGAVAARFTAMYPALVGRICLIAPAVAGLFPGAVRFLTLPGVGRLAAELLTGAILKRNLADIFACRDMATGFIQDCLGQLHRISYRRAILSTLRHTLLDRTSYAYAALNTINIPSSLIWGTEDTVVPFARAESVRQALGSCAFHPIQGAGHCPAWERADEINRLLADFL
jgi:pimeloyl-ACP methyl ester carboxylesterase